MAFFMTNKFKAALPAKGFHLRRDNRIFPCAPQTGQICVVNDALRSGAAPVHQPFVQKAFHPEAVERAIELQISPFGITQIHETCDQPAGYARQLDLIFGRVVLELGARCVRHASAPLFLRLADAQVPQHPRQSRILHLDAFFFCQLFMNPLNPAIAFPI